MISSPEGSAQLPPSSSELLAGVGEVSGDHELGCPSRLGPRRTAARHHRRADPEQMSSSSYMRQAERPERYGIPQALHLLTMQADCVGYRAHLIRRRVEETGEVKRPASRRRA